MRSLSLGTLLGFAFLAGVLCAPVPAHAEDLKPVILSGCEFDYPPFCIVDEQQRADGFSVELLRAALAAMDRAVRFRVGPWNEIKQLLAHDQLDVLPLVGRTPEREGIYDFTFPYLSMRGAVVVRQGTAGIRSIDDLDGRDVAVMKGDNAEEFVSRSGRDWTIHTTPTFVDAFKALSEGQFDAVVIQRLLATRLISQEGFIDLRIVGPPIEEFRQDFCFAVTEGDREMLSVLNEGLALVIADGTFARLQRKWLGSRSLPGRSTITVGVEQAYPPYSMLDDTGEPSGFNVELTRAISEAIGLQIDIAYRPWTQIRKDLANGLIDAVCGMYYSQERARVFNFSPPYASVHHAVFAHSESPPLESQDDLRGRSLIVMRGDIMHDYVAAKNLSEEVTAVESTASAVRMLSSGRHDFALLAELPGLYWVNELGIDNIDTVGPVFPPSQYCFAVRAENHELLQELNEGLAIVKQTGEYDALCKKWFGSLKPEAPGVDVLLKFAAIVFCVLLALLAGALVWS